MQVWYRIPMVTTTTSVAMERLREIATMAFLRPMTFFPQAATGSMKMEELYSNNIITKLAE